jgi:hypothetical protein
MTKGTLMKLVRRALDESAPQDAEIAASLIFQELRRNKVEWHRVWTELHPGNFNAFVMPWGEHKGKNMAWIVDNDVGYAEWLAADSKSNFIKTVAKEAIAAAKGEQCAKVDPRAV